MDTVKIEFPINNVSPYSEESAVRHMVNALHKLIKFGAIKGNLDEIVRNYEIHNPGGFAVAIVDKSCIVDPSKFQSCGAGLSFPMDMDPSQNEGSTVISTDQRQFSATTIQERLRISKLDPKMKFRLTIRDYQKYYQKNRNKLANDRETTIRLKNMFLMDTMSIFNEVLPLIEDGKQLSVLTGLNNVTKDMNAVARDLSLAYKRAIKQSRTGTLSKNVLVPLQSKYSEFMNKLIPQVFVGIEDTLRKDAQYSFTSDGRVKLF